MTKVDLSNCEYTDHFIKRAKERFGINEENVKNWISENKDMVVDRNRQNGYEATNGDGLFFVFSSGQKLTLKTCYSGVKYKKIAKIHKDLFSNIKKELLHAKIEVTKTFATVTKENLNSLEILRNSFLNINSVDENIESSDLEFETIFEHYNSFANAIKNNFQQLNQEVGKINDFLINIEKNYKFASEQYELYDSLVQKESSKGETGSTVEIFELEEEEIDFTVLEGKIKENKDAFQGSLNALLGSHNNTIDAIDDDNLGVFMEDAQDAMFSSAANEMVESFCEAVVPVKKLDLLVDYLADFKKLTDNASKKEIANVKDLEFSLLGKNILNYLIEELTAFNVNKKIKKQLSQKKVKTIKSFENYLKDQLKGKVINIKDYKAIMFFVFKVFAFVGYIKQGEYSIPSEKEKEKFASFLAKNVTNISVASELKELHESMPFEGFILKANEIKGVGKGTVEKMIKFKKKFEKEDLQVKNNSTNESKDFSEFT